MSLKDQFQRPDSRFVELQKRIKELENEVKKRKSKEKETSEKQQLLILHYLGFIDKIDLTTIKKAELLSSLLNKNNQNIRNDLTYINGKGKENIFTEDNIKFVYELFKKVGLSDIAKKIEKENMNYF
jgi:hypothetical protein